MSDNAQLIENAKLDIAPVTEFLQNNKTEIDDVAKRVATLLKTVTKVYRGSVESAIDELQNISYQYEEGHREAENILDEVTSGVNKLGMGIDSVGGYLWIPSTTSC